MRNAACFSFAVGSRALFLSRLSAQLAPVTRIVSPSVEKSFKNVENRAILALRDLETSSLDAATDGQYNKGFGPTSIFYAIVSVLRSFMCCLQVVVTERE